MGTRLGVSTECSTNLYVRVHLYTRRTIFSYVYVDMLSYVLTQLDANLHLCTSHVSICSQHFEPSCQYMCRRDEAEKWCLDACTDSCSIGPAGQFIPREMAFDLAFVLMHLLAAQGWPLCWRRDHQIHRLCEAVCFLGEFQRWQLGVLLSQHEPHGARLWNQAKQNRGDLGVESRQRPWARSAFCNKLIHRYARRDASACKAPAPSLIRFIFKLAGHGIDSPAGYKAAIAAGSCTA